MMERNSFPDRRSETPTPELFKRVANEMTLLAKKEVELAKTESKAELDYEVKVLSGVAICGAFAFLGLNLAVAAALLGLVGWMATCVVGVVALIIGSCLAYFFWKKNIKQPVPYTQETLKEDARWLKQAIKKNL